MGVNNMDKQFTGLIDDPRSDLEKLKDWKHEETIFSLAMGAPIVWEEKTPDKWKRYSTRNQDGSTSCVPQAFCKGYEVYTGKVLSATPLYNNRPNYPQKGSYPQAIAEYFRKVGTTLESDVPSQNINDNMMDSYGKDFSKYTLYKIEGYSTLKNPRNFDEIVASVANGNPVHLTIHASYREYCQDIPKYLGDPKELGHEVVVTDYFLYNGVQVLKEDESWGRGISSFDDQRLLTREFIENRCDNAVTIYLKPLPKPSDEKPQHVFNVSMVYGDKNEEVKWLQKVLVYEGFLKPIFITGYFGDITFSAVRKWQEKHYEEILKPAGIKQGGATGKVLTFSRAYLNKEYGV